MSEGSQMLTGQLAAIEINRAVEREVEPSTGRIRAIARRILFQSITEQMPHLDRKVRRELARQYERDRWNSRSTTHAT